MQFNVIPPGHHIPSLVCVPITSLVLIPNLPLLHPDKRVALCSLARREITKQPINSHIITIILYGCQIPTKEYPDAPLRVRGGGETAVKL